MIQLGDINIQVLKVLRPRVHAENEQHLYFQDQGHQKKKKS